MIFATSARSSQTYEAASRFAVSPAKLRSRLIGRRNALAGGLISYTLGGLILLLYVHAGVIPFTIASSFVLAGATVVAAFLALSEMHVLDHFADHYLVVVQVAAHAAVQFLFLVAAPQIGYAFLSVLFLILQTGSLRMTVRQATIAWGLIAAGAAPLFLLLEAPISMAVSTPLERFAALLCFVATIAQCTFVGLYGNSLRWKLYKSGVELKLAYSRIEELAELDELTGAFNRRCIMRMLEDEITTARPSRTPGSVALIDLDWFKRVNDLYGHPTGDEVLRKFAFTMFANIRPEDRFGRYGGEEFLLLLPGTDESAAVRRLDRLRLTVSEIDWSSISSGIALTISVGVTTLTDGDTAEACLARADRALYAAKHGGRNRIASLTSNAVSSQIELPVHPAPAL